MEHDEEDLRFERIPADILVGVAEVQKPVTDGGTTFLLGLENEFHEGSLYLVHALELRLGRPAHKAMENGKHKGEIILHAKIRSAAIPQARFPIVALEAIHPVFLEGKRLAVHTAGGFAAHAQGPQPMQMGTGKGQPGRERVLGLASLTTQVQFKDALVRRGATHQVGERHLGAILFESRELDGAIVTHGHGLREIDGTVLDDGLLEEGIEQFVDAFLALLREAEVRVVVVGLLFHSEPRDLGGIKFWG